MIYFREFSRCNLIEPFMDSEFPICSIDRYFLGAIQKWRQNWISEAQTPPPYLSATRPKWSHILGFKPRPPILGCQRFPTASPYPLADVIFGWPLIVEILANYYVIFAVLNRKHYGKDPACVVFKSPCIAITPWCHFRDVTDFNYDEHSFVGWKMCNL